MNIQIQAAFDRSLLVSVGWVIGAKTIEINVLCTYF